MKCHKHAKDKEKKDYRKVLSDSVAQMSKMLVSAFVFSSVFVSAFEKDEDTMEGYECKVDGGLIMQQWASSRK